jgi:hypothetical protein
MIQLRDKDKGTQIGFITEKQLQFLVDQLEEEHEGDKDYWLNRDTLEILKESGADQQLISLLENALGERDEMEIERESK